MPKSKKATVMKSAVLEKLVSGSMNNLQVASDGGAKAIASRSAEAKKLLAESKRISKKRAILIRRKKTTSMKLKKVADAATRKILRDVEKELAAIKKVGEKVRASKTSLAEELKGLKENQKRAATYLNVIEKADKILNKPKKKKRRRRVKKA